MNPLLFFTDPVFSAPTIAMLLMGLACGMVGVLVFVRKRSLLGETLSHATYPGVALAAFFLTGSFLSWGIMVGAFVSSLVALFLIERLITRYRISEDAALCFTLATFFGLGVTVVSLVQNIKGSVYRQIQAYLYGQAATMTDRNVWIYALFFVLVLVCLFLFYRELQVLLFDPLFAKISDLSVKMIRLLVHFLLTCAIVISIRSVGVILMTAMLIGPPVAARQYTNKLSTLFILSGLFGMLGAFFGNLLSVYLSLWTSISFPTGPVVVLCIAIISLFSIMMAPHRGLLFRFIRIAHFRLDRVSENILKTIWHLSSKEGPPFCEIEKRQGFSKWYLIFHIKRLCRKGLLKQAHGGCYRLTLQGEKMGARIVRLHRLWELYLVNYLGMGAQKVHANAEEMEHILTPAMEQELTQLLKDPKVDPHQQPIPLLEEG